MQTFHPVYKYAGIFLLFVGQASLLLYAKQHTFGILLSSFSLAFFAYIILLYTKQSLASIVQISFIVFIIKAMGIFFMPGLSDDIYRFWWDGFLSIHNVNPFKYTPTEAIIAFKNVPVILAPLNEYYCKLNSPDYHSVYPSFCQAIFYFSALIGKGDIYIFHKVLFLFFLIADFILIYCLKWLVKNEHLTAKYMLLVIANPLYITEGIYNLHFESWVITFLALTWVYIKRSQYIASGLSIGLAVVSKLNPLLLLPLFVKSISKLKNQINFISGFAFIALSLPFLVSAYYAQMMQSVQLYVGHFEFNSVIYRPLTFLSEQMQWWTFKPMVGKLLSIIFIFFYILITSAYKNNFSNSEIHLFSAMWLIYFVYLLSSSTVHPWYILPLLFFAMLSPFPITSIIFSMLSIFSYACYSYGAQNHALAFRILEYSLVFLCFMNEFRRWNIIRPYLH